MRVVALGVEFCSAMALAHFFGRRNSFFDFPDPFDAMVSIMDHSPASSFMRDAHAMASTNVDWKETPTEHVFVADLPGLKKEEIKVQIEDGNMLTISGQRIREDVQSTDTWHRAERSSGQFKRRFRLPEGTNLDRVSAKMENGVLAVTVPKVEAERENNLRSIEIDGNEGEQPLATDQNSGDNVVTAATTENGK